MNFLNRTVIIFELLIALVAAPVLVAALFFARGAINQTLLPAITKLLGDQLDPIQFICMGVLGVIFLIALLLLLFELYRPEMRHLKVESVEGADVSITADAIIRRLEYEIESLPHVIKAKPQISASGRDKAVNVLMELLLSPDADIAAKTQEVTVLTRNVLEQRMSLKAGKIGLKIDHAKLPPPSKEMKKTLPPAGINPPQTN